jgi:hypothetical protein
MEFQDLEYLKAIQTFSPFSSIKAEPSIPLVACGYEAIYERFLNGSLIYRPSKKSDAGMMTLPIRELKNPLEGKFQLFYCQKRNTTMAIYLSISTGYRKRKNTDLHSIEIWVAPRFLIERELNTTAKHFNSIMGNWKPEAEVGLFWTWSGWASDDHDMDHLTTENMDSLSKIDLYENWKKSKSTNKFGCAAFGVEAKFGVGFWMRHFSFDFPRLSTELNWPTRAEPEQGSAVP